MYLYIHGLSIPQVPRWLYVQVPLLWIVIVSHAVVVEATFHWSGHIREIAKGGPKFSRFLTSIDKISPPVLQIVRTLLHKIIHIIL